MSDQAPTFNQIDEQLANEQPASVLVERSNGDITVGQVLGRGENTGRVFMGNMEAADSDIAIMPNRVVSAEELTDEHQQKLAAELAGLALRGDEVQEPAKPVGWAAWVEANPLSDQQTAAIQQSVDKNITLTQMYGSTNFNNPQR